MPGSQARGLTSGEPATQSELSHVPAPPSVHMHPAQVSQAAHAAHDALEAQAAAPMLPPAPPPPIGTSTAARAPPD